MATSARRIGISTVITTALILSSVNPTMADDDSKSKPETKMKIQNKKVKLKFGIEEYKAAMETRDEAREKINETFKKAIKKATRDANEALANALTPEERMIIMNNFKNARRAAVALRNSALQALGSLPDPPVEAKKDKKRRTLAP
ncbi:MAG: hypothetical protein F2708_02040 [Actinobacteria bacterium]|uniref:Unannotated protein n=1 Tax=freshwater metagenome TaxID=449393 RepID=A0A6J6YT03_9ZZZZ|nr:hypothetical protein [Actinomycetota bacterium]MSY93592.1 hypothetical protein [Actinomycetota bacterium]